MDRILSRFKALRIYLTIDSGGPITDYTGRLTKALSVYSLQKLAAATWN